MLAEFIVASTLSLSGGASPIIDTGPGPKETRLVALDLEALDDLGQDAILSDVPLGNNVVVDLAVERFEVFAPDATLLVVGDDAERPLDRPAVTLLRGEVVGVPGSTVFLSLGAMPSTWPTPARSLGPFGRT